MLDVELSKLGILVMVLVSPAVDVYKHFFSNEEILVRAPDSGDATRAVGHTWLLNLLACWWLASCVVTAAVITQVKSNSLAAWIVIESALIALGLGVPMAITCWGRHCSTSVLSVYANVAHSVRRQAAICVQMCLFTLLLLPCESSASIFANSRSNKAAIDWQRAFQWLPIAVSGSLFVLSASANACDAICPGRGVARTLRLTRNRAGSIFVETAMCPFVFLLTNTQFCLSPATPTSSASDAGYAAFDCLENNKTSLSRALIIDDQATSPTGCIWSTERITMRWLGLLSLIVLMLELFRYSTVDTKSHTSRKQQLCKSALLVVLLACSFLHSAREYVVVMSVFAVCSASFLCFSGFWLYNSTTPSSDLLQAGRQRRLLALECATVGLCFAIGVSVIGAVYDERISYWWNSLLLLGLPTTVVCITTVVLTLRPRCLSCCWGTSSFQPPDDIEAATNTHQTAVDTPSAATPTRRTSRAMLSSMEVLEIRHHRTPSSIAGAAIIIGQEDVAPPPPPGTDATPHAAIPPVDPFNTASNPMLHAYQLHEMDAHAKNAARPLFDSVLVGDVRSDGSSPCNPDELEDDADQPWDDERSPFEQPRAQHHDAAIGQEEGNEPLWNPEVLAEVVHGRPPSTGETSTVAAATSVAGGEVAATAASGAVWNAHEDAENQMLYQTVGGYHPTSVGEVFGDRFVAIAKLGWGEFSIVWLARDMHYHRLRSREFVVIKISKSAHEYFAATKAEGDILRDTINSIAAKHSGAVNVGVTKFIAAFEHKGVNGTHMVIAMDLCGPNLLRLITAHEFHGVHLDIVRVVARGVLHALQQLHEDAGVMHCDVKPENTCLSRPAASTMRTIMEFQRRVGVPPPAMLFTEDAARIQEASLRGEFDPADVAALYSVQLADFGSARCVPPSHAAATQPPSTEQGSRRKSRKAASGGGKKVKVSLLQTREYRAPEIVLGFPDDALSPALDVWSAACMFFELATGSFLFDPKGYEDDPRFEDYVSKDGIFDVNGCHVALLMQLTSSVPSPLVEQGTLSHLYFAPQQVQPSQSKTTPTFAFNGVRLPKLTLSAYLAKHFRLHERYGSDAAEQFASFLKCALVLDPAKRPTATQLLEHPFLLV